VLDSLAEEGTPGSAGEVGDIGIGCFVDIILASDIDLKLDTRTA
jgi:hypothetical protein